ncbi:hypothetical protein Xmau_02338 [Xenorhabdus mauleonii]|uniref:Guanylate cyclase domain-containing protein n=1 Tax=Xenorhabdus mauleonii TaxID=351675 RepID=A0A1I3TGK8_9GAMM|nr:hypothetical protein [Xenorhabdus mauleonii]PHM39740.1 hypothetical protein Xmau_02338 [Xenorhabdus mauleonii]SFJ70334.1 hypothetical protein SAMN05421680_11428 [Xenorhabdus mauleonii]
MKKKLTEKLTTIKKEKIKTERNFGNNLKELINHHLDCAEKDWQQVRHNFNECTISPDDINDLNRQSIDGESISDEYITDGSINSIGKNIVSEPISSFPPSYYRHANNIESTLKKEMIETLIPGYPFLENNKPEVGEFVAFMMDMRNSSSSFKQYSTSPIIECGLQKIFYETSSLIPAITYTAAQEGGKVTELLGDGALILFHIKPGNLINVINRAYVAAEICINNTMHHVNDILWQRYKFPPLKIGIGLSYGSAIIKVMNVSGYHPKVIGQCVWEAAKLSNGENTIGLSKEIEEILNLTKAY